MEQPIVNSFTKGVRDGLPIGLGYLSVSFTFGMMAATAGLPVWAAVMISMTNLTSAGQFAGLSLILTAAPYLEMAVTTLVINLRYTLMSLSLSQKLDKKVSTLERCLIAFGNTDEIFAVASGQKGDVGTKYMLGLMLTPYLGWVLGTFVGAAASGFLPASVRSALGIAIYGMFLAIILPPAKHLRPVALVLVVSVVLSSLFHWVPLLNQVSSGFVIIICGVAASAIGAKWFPIDDGEVDNNG